MSKWINWCVWCVSKSKPIARRSFVLIIIPSWEDLLRNPCCVAINTMLLSLCPSSSTISRIMLSPRKGCNSSSEILFIRCCCHNSSNLSFLSALDFINVVGSSAGILFIYPGAIWKESSRARDRLSTIILHMNTCFTFTIPYSYARNLKCSHKIKNHSVGSPQPYFSARAHVVLSSRKAWLMLSSISLLRQGWSTPWATIISDCYQAKVYARAHLESYYLNSRVRSISSCSNHARDCIYTGIMLKLFETRHSST